MSSQLWYKHLMFWISYKTVKVLQNFKNRYGYIEGSYEINNMGKLNVGNRSKIH